MPISSKDTSWVTRKPSSKNNGAYKQGDKNFAKVSGAWRALDFEPGSGYGAVFELTSSASSRTLKQTVSSAYANAGGVSRVYVLRDDWTVIQELESVASGGQTDIPIPTNAKYIAYGASKLSNRTTFDHQIYFASNSIIKKIASFNENIFKATFYPATFSISLESVPTVLPRSISSLANAFNGCSIFNHDISSWDTSLVVSMVQAFISAPKFNQPLGAWNVSNVTNMQNCFAGASAFAQNLSMWDVAKVTVFAGFASGSGMTTAQIPPKFR